MKGVIFPMRVTLARDYESAKGKKVKADQTVDLPDGEARNLIYTGIARPAAAEPKVQPNTTTEKEVK